MNNSQTLSPKTYVIVASTGEFVEVTGRDMLDALFSFKGNYRVIKSITEKENEKPNGN